MLLAKIAFVISACAAAAQRDSKQWTSRTNLVCKDHPIQCDYYWSRGWYTCKNGGALWEYCPESCGLCGKKACEDKHRSCSILQKFGYCVKYEKHMRRECAKTCEFCKVEQNKPKLLRGCRDYEDNCPKWKSYGECKRSKDTMKYCPKSCGYCGDESKVKMPNLPYKKCEDTKPSLCKQSYFCARSRNLASKYCRKTCKMCVRSGSCYDRNSLCYWYKHKGYCKRQSYYYRDIAPRCPYSCGLCKL